MRTTRAALRAQAHSLDDTQLQFIHEDSDASSLREDPGANQDVPRPVLKDITTENHPTTDDNIATEDTAPLKRAKSKRKGKQTKDAHQADLDPHAVLEEQDQAVPESAHHSDLETSLYSDHDQSTSQVESTDEETRQDTSIARTSCATPDPTNSLGAALSCARNDPPKTPKFDPSIHTPEEQTTPLATDSMEDSFVENIKTRSPSKMQGQQEEAGSPAALPESLMPRTPRIEDSVEAIDALEDAIEKISGKLPDLDELKIESPVKSRNTAPVPAPRNPPTTTTAGTLKPASRTAAKTPRDSPTKRAAVVPSAVQSKPTTARRPVPKSTKAPAVVTQPPKRPVVDRVKPRESSVASRPTPSLSSSHEALPNTTKKRVPSTKLSTSKPGFVPSKSVKPPTKSTFSLPGEIISAKLKAQREERLKREEEAEKERKMFKARPAPIKSSRPSVLPRDNKASQARLSVYAGGVNKENISPKAGPVERKPRPSLFTAKAKADMTQANSSMRRTTNVVAKLATTKPRVSSMQLAAGEKLSVTKEDAAQQKVKGKEVFGRRKTESERLEKERKEKEDATRKARAEAAERGRQASHEWAEKQRKKMAMQAAAKSPASGKEEGHPQAISAS